MRRTLTALMALTSFASLAGAQTTAPAGKLPFVTVNVKDREVRVECEALHVDAPLEFFCVIKGSSEHESVLRTRAKPSDIHLGLLMLGLEAGEPVKYSEALKAWIPPHGSPLRIAVEFAKDGRTITLDANRLMRGLKDKKEMPATHWIFSGSRMTPENQYAADITGYVVSVVNFDLTMIDIPEIKSSANETLEWQLNPDLAPPLGTAVTMIIRPMGDGDDKPKLAPATQPGAQADGKAGNVALTDVQMDAALVQRLREKWNDTVRPHASALRQASQTQYEVISSLRHEQQRLIDEADRIQRVIDELEREYQDLTTPKPAEAR